MATVTFTPAQSVRYTHTDDRQLEFTQDSEGVVSIRVFFGLSEINTVYQHAILVERNSTGLQQMKPRSMRLMSDEKRKNILDSVSRAITTHVILDEKSPIRLEIQNGPMTNIESRRKSGTKFFEAREITICMQ